MTHIIAYDVERMIGTDKSWEWHFLIKAVNTGLRESQLVMQTA